MMRVSLVFILFLIANESQWPWFSGVKALPSGSEKHNELIIHQALEQTLLNDTTGELFRLRNAFFPSTSDKNFWRVDGLQAVQFDTCLTISDLACRTVNDSQGVFSGGATFVTRCWQFQWTNNYLLGLMATQQLYQFEPLVTSLTYLQTVGHREVEFKVRLNLTDPILCSVQEEDLEKYFTSFISWTKAYAAAQGKPTTWSVDLQGYVSRKYNSYTKGITNNGLQIHINFALLACFVCCNLLTVYLLIACNGRLYRKASNLSEHSSTYLIKSTCKGLVLLMGCLLGPAYIIGLFVGHAGGVYPKYYPPCSESIYHKCEPPHSSYMYQLEVVSFYCKVSILIFALCVYLLASLYTVVRNTPSLLCKKRSMCSQCAEVYFWWSALFGMHICFGLASIPILILLIITPIYTIFFIVSIGFVVTFLSLPLIICLHHRQLASGLRMCQLVNKMFVYVLVMSFTVAFVYLYYCFLLGGASMNGIKGIVFSLIPPAVVAAFGFYIRYTLKRKKRNREHVPTESERIITNREKI